MTYLMIFSEESLRDGPVDASDDDLLDLDVFLCGPTIRQTEHDCLHLLSHEQFLGLGRVFVAECFR